MPWNPGAVISKLDVRIQTLTPPGTPTGLPQPWVSQTPSNANEALSQSILIKNRIARHQGSSPTPILQAVDQLTKAVVVVNHTVTLMAGELKQTREANEILSKHRRTKRSRLQDSGPLSGLQASQLLEEKGLVEQERCNNDEKEGSLKRCRITA